MRVKIKKHKIFTRKGADLVIIKKISLLEALTGVTMEIDHLDGAKHTIATAPGEVLINKELKSLKRLGMPFYKDMMGFGNLYIEFFVDFPKRNSLTRDKIEKIRDIIGIDEEKLKPKNKPKLLEEYD